MMGGRVLLQKLGRSGRSVSTYLWLTLSVWTVSGYAQSEGGDITDAIDSVYVHAGTYAHFTNSEDYDGTPWFGGVELTSRGRHLFGISVFNNSFDQFSQYFYYGYKWNLPSISRSMHVKLTGGIIHGYRGEFEDKVPINNNGWSPAIIPSIGWKQGRIGFDFSLLGTAGVLFTAGYDIWER